ncbi:hypothetical protein GCM10029963_36960 [Micromonospora andamanensis]
MLKIHFSGEDILRTRVAPAADPVWEVVLSLHLLPGRSRDPLLAGWRREVSRGLRRQVDAEALRLLSTLSPPAATFRTSSPRTRACTVSRRGWRRYGVPRCRCCTAI